MNVKGRTALMKTTLWDHLSIVQQLIEADTSTDMKDHADYTALNLAEDNPYNEIEHANHSALYVDHLDKRRQRRKIVTLLDYTAIQTPNASNIIDQNGTHVRPCTLTLLPIETICLITPSYHLSSQDCPISKQYFV